MINCIHLVHNLIMKKMENGELNLESKEALKSVLREYENHTKIIEDQLEIFKKDHVGLRREIEQLVKENKHLSLQLESKSGGLLHKGEKLHLEDNSIIENLQQELSSTIEEKTAIEKLWKSCVKEAESLREKLRDSQSGRQITMLQSKLNDVKHDYTEVIKLLESRLEVVKKENDQLTVKNKLLESQLSQVTSQMSVVGEQNLSLKASLKDVTNSELDWKSRYLNLESKFIEVERAYQADKIKFSNVYEFEKVESNLKAKLESVLRQRDELEGALEQCHRRAVELTTNAANDRSRIAEAVSLVEGALQREALSLEEAKKVKTELNRQLEDVRRRLDEEKSALQKQFDNQLTALQEQLHIVEQDRNRKAVEVDQLQRECDRLQRECDRLHGLLDADRPRQVTDSREEVHRELRAAESRLDQLTMDNKALHAVVNKLEDKCQRNSREKDKLKYELKRQDQQRLLCQQELVTTSQRADILNTEVNRLRLELAQAQSESYFHLTNVSNADSKAALNTLGQLYKQMDDSYSHMNDKWKKEITDLTEKFEDKLKKVKIKNKITSQSSELSKKQESATYMNESQPRK